MEMRRILKPTGSLYLHIDHTAHAYVKALMDAIFGRHNFKNEIVWGYRGMPSKARRWQQKHDTLLFYTKSGDYRFTVLRNPPTAGSQRTFASAMNRGYNLNRSKKMVTVFDWDKYRAAVAEGTIPSDLQPKEFTGGQPPMMDWWEDIRILGGPKNKERVGYPTQKPLALYERIIRASSSKGEMVLDPFCGCATTPVAAERLGRQWIGMDIWDGAAKIVRQRMEDNRQLLADPDPQIYYSTTPAQRTDENEVAAPFLKLKMQRALEPWQRLRHGQIVECLVEAQATGGLVICAGCGRVLEREFMQLDHIQPRAEGGANDITNRILLCQPCNGRKGADYTLIGLVRRNKKIGWTQNADRARLAQDSARRKPFATAKSLDNPKALRYWVFLA